MVQKTSQIVDEQWVPFPGGELEGKRPKALCSQCRERLRRASAGPAVRQRPNGLCFQCYRAELEREKAFKGAGEFAEASADRFQAGLPFEPVNLPRLEMLKAERVAHLHTMREGTGRFVHKRRQAQISARHALQRIAAGLKACQLPATERERSMADAIHAAELQFPEAWLPFVVSR